MVGQLKVSSRKERTWRRRLTKLSSSEDFHLQNQQAPQRLEITGGPPTRASLAGEGCGIQALGKPRGWPTLVLYFEFYSFGHIGRLPMWLNIINLFKIYTHFKIFWNTLKYPTQGNLCKCCNIRCCRTPLPRLCVGFILDFIIYWTRL